ncbi:unnamed protein product [Urochloa decumbens]|uniref:Uncharacterized protein n=1 Tax=Urochloa decumbens TaxID=240449 RepID=A0ABC8XZI0_9POAL
MLTPRSNPVEEDAKATVAAAAAVYLGPPDRLQEVERLRVGGSHDPLEPPAQVLHPSAGEPAGAGGHGPQLLQHPPLRVRRRLPPRRVPGAPAVAVDQPFRRGEERARSGGGGGRPLALVLEHDPAGRGDVGAAEAGRQVEHEEVLVVRWPWVRGLPAALLLLEEEADAAIAGGGQEERAADGAGFGGRRRRAREERGGKGAADILPPREPRDVAAVVRRLLPGASASAGAAVFHRHYCRRHGCGVGRPRVPHLAPTAYI